jgi:hypothetical protein
MPQDPQRPDITGTITPADSSAPAGSQPLILSNDEVEKLRKRGGGSTGPGPLVLPKNFTNMRADEQKKIIGTPETEEFGKLTSQQIEQTATQALPWIAGGVGAVVVPEFELPFVPGWVSAVARGGARAVIGGLASGGGKAAEIGIEKATGMPGTPENAADFWKQVGGTAEQAALMEGVGQVFGGLTSAYLASKFNPETMYMQALKPSGKIPTEDAKRMVQEALSRGVKPTLEEAENIKFNIRPEINRKIRAVIANSPTKNIPASTYVKNIENEMDAIRREYRFQPSGAQRDADLAAIDRMEKDFLVTWGRVQTAYRWTPPSVGPPTASSILGPGGKPIMNPGKIIPGHWTKIEPKDMDIAMLRARARPLPTQTAQNIKQGAWKKIRTDAPATFAEGAADTKIWPEMNRRIGQSLKIDLENAIGTPLKDLNLKYGAEKDLEKTIRAYVNRQRAEGRFPNYVFPSVGRAVGRLAPGAVLGGYEGYSQSGRDWRWGVAGAAVGGAGSFLLKGLLDDPEFKVWAANNLYKAGKYPGAGFAKRAIAAMPGAAGRAFYPGIQDTTGAAQEDQFEPFNPNEYGPSRPPSFGITPPGATPYKPPPSAPLPEEPKAEAQPPKPEEIKVQDYKPIAERNLSKALTTYKDMLERTGSTNGAPPGMMLAIAQNENAQGDPNATGPIITWGPDKGKRAMGLMQIAPSMIPKGMQWNDPQQSAYIASQIIKERMAARQGDGSAQIPLVLADYVAGSKQVDEWRKSGVDFPSGVRDYVARGLKNMGYPDGQAQLMMRVLYGKSRSPSR